jgi:hypothetical protein
MTTENAYQAGQFPTEEHDGDARLRRIARAGKQWKNTMARTVDMEGELMRACSLNRGGLMSCPSIRV